MASLTFSYQLLYSLSLCRFVASNLDKTWFKMEAQADLVQTLIGIMARATNCSEFQEHCLRLVQAGEFPPEVIDFWYMGSRTCVEKFNSKLLLKFKSALTDIMGGETPKLDPQILVGKDYESLPGMEKNYRMWTMDQNEGNNTEDILDYLPSVAIRSNAIFHAVTTQMAFCSESFERDGKYRLFLSTQPPVNNRDINIELMDTMGTPNPEKVGMFDYCVNRPSLAGEDHNRYNLSDGHRILIEMKRREDVRDEDMRKSLSPFTTMLPITSTATNPKDRRKGKKTVGDQVGVGLSLEAVISFYKVLTVSVDSNKNIFEHFRFENIVFTNHDHISFLLQGHDFDQTAFDGKAYLDEPRKVIAVFLRIHDLLMRDTNYRIDTLTGRMNLYCLLLVQNFGTERIQQLLDEADRQATKMKQFGSYSLLNLLLPATVGEMSLRLKWLYGATTDMMVAASESQKRQFCSTFNDLNLKLISTPIDSFFEIPDRLVLQHRPDPKGRDAQEFLEKWGDCERKYFSRSSALFTSHIYACNPQSYALTTKMVQLIEDHSSTMAENNNSNETKTIEGYIQKVIRSCIELPCQLEMIIAKKPGDPPSYPIEKDIASQACHMRRLLLERFFELGFKVEYQRNEGVETLVYTTRVEGIAKLYRNFAAGAEKELSKWLNESVPCSGTRTDPNKRHSKTNERIAPTQQDVGCYQNMKTWLEFTSPNREKNRSLYADKNNYDPLLQFFTGTLLVPEHTLDPEKAFDPSNIEWWFATRLFLHKEVSKVGKVPLKFKSDCTPRHWQALLSLFALLAVDQDSCKLLADTIENNGRKKISTYQHDLYDHESGGGEVVNCVSHVLFYSIASSPFIFSNLPCSFSFISNPGNLPFV